MRTEVHGGRADEAPLFQTARLTCRRWLPHDRDALYAVYADAEAMRWVGDGRPITLAECDEWFVVTANNYARRGYGMFTVVDRASQAVAGFGGLVHPGGQAEPEVKYAFARAHWGQGLATEFVRALLAYGASAHGLQRVIATVAAEHLASQRVLRKAGLRHEACRTDDDGSQTHVYAWRAPAAA